MSTSIFLLRYSNTKKNTCTITQPVTEPHKLYQDKVITSHTWPHSRNFKHPKDPKDPKTFVDLNRRQHAYTVKSLHFSLRFRLITAATQILARNGLKHKYRFVNTSGTNIHLPSVRFLDIASDLWHDQDTQCLYL